MFFIFWGEKNDFFFGDRLVTLSPFGFLPCIRDSLFLKICLDKVVNKWAGNVRFTLRSVSNLGFLGCIGILCSCMNS